MKFIRQSLFIAWFDLRNELKSGQVLLPIILFSVILTTLFHYAVYEGSTVSFRIVCGFYWIVFAFSGYLFASQIMRREQENGVLNLILASPLNRTSFFTGKLLALSALNLFNMLLVSVIFALFFDMPSGKMVESLFLSALFAIPGASSLGVLLLGLTGGSRLQELVMPVLYFPLLLPLFLTGVKWSLGISASAEFYLNWPLPAFSLFWVWLTMLVHEAVWVD